MILSHTLRMRFFPHAGSIASMLGSAEGDWQYSPYWCSSAHPNWRTSARWPVMAAAAAMAGPIRWVLAFLPWRPSKLRVEVAATRSSFIALSALLDMHIDQRGSRHL